ncbi:RecX family transcriptional regulator [Paenibacillus allorhizosphaerae]|uniref:Regulatory protein RecX n=1 Tax=Paenibacillus allorhizosphaerae TaxID=2849866 RepID=A0ABM8VCK9_9BACL|nr:RecX family transcriptional regulator [Paenibacillus allorhizosphaerae]CAG7624188.1 Regulatory protein RecX [Paenibacillus allorhizosphaerae]
MSGENHNQTGLITKVERQKRSPHRYNIFVDENFSFSVHEDILIKYRLMKGEQLEEAGLRQILHAEEANRAYLDAIRLLSNRLRSEHEMRARLKQKGYDPDIVGKTMERLQNEKYLDDELFAEQLTRQRLESQKKGRYFIRQELQQKGIKKDTIHGAMELVDEETEFRMAFGLAEKRYASELNRDPVKARPKIAGFLQRRGYPGSVVSRVLKQLSVGKQEEEEWDADEIGDEF